MPSWLRVYRPLTSFSLIADRPPPSPCNGIIQWVGHVRQGEAKQTAGAGCTAPTPAGPAGGERPWECRRELGDH